MGCKVLLIAFLACIALVGCTQAPPQSRSLNGQAVTATPVEVQIKGSDTMLQLSSLLAESYQRQNPAERLTVTGGGSGTGIAALINGEASIANASRPIKAEELEKANRDGHDVQEIAIARDLLSIILSKDNPVTQLTKDQLARIYRGEITNWKDVGGNDTVITLYGRQSSSGTYVFFQEDILKGDYSPKMRNMEGNEAIVDAVRQDASGIGYVGIGYAVDAQKNIVNGIGVLSIADSERSAFVSPLDPTTQPSYPVSRLLFQYLASRPASGDSIDRFVRFELSPAGQQLVEKSGFIALLPSEIAENNAKLLHAESG
ncbi:MAG: PstS family phosphate ABC transporter substrate-binding protein [Candidatus Diapherotrites archaeon]|nr:PstS family phosphate ABC transporter substrate-binding protein [Candidatus Diapherotrites archaeon]